MSVTANSSNGGLPGTVDCGDNSSITLLSQAILGRSLSDRRLKNNRARSAAAMTSSVPSNQASTPDMDQARNAKQSKKPMYASLKFIDDGSPLTTGNSISTTARDVDKNWPLEHRHSEPPIDQEQSQIRRISIRPSIDSGVHSLEVQCGIGPYRPSCLQKFANKSWMLFWLCWFCAVQGMLVSGLVPSVLSTIERRFNFRAASLGRIMQWYDIGYALCCVPVSYFGGRHSKPVFIGIGLLIMGTGSFIFSLPHLIGDAQMARETNADNIGSCILSTAMKNELGTSSIVFDHPINVPVNETVTDGANCDMLRQQRDSFFGPILTGTFRFEVLFCFAHLLHGIGATPLFTLGVSYIDENVKPTLSSLYIAIFYTFVIIGPAAGFLISGAFLRFHSDFLSTEIQTRILDLDETDPEWVGAWWIGFQIASILSLFAVFPILSFPKSLPGALEWQRSRMHRNVAVGVSNESDDKYTGSRRNSKNILPHRNRPAAVAATTTCTVSSTDPCTSSPPSLPHAGSTFMADDFNPEAKRVPLLQRLLVDLRHMPSAVRRLVTNPAYMCITLAASVEGLLIAGLSGFMAKYLERQFNVASSRANMLIGCIMVPVAGLGTLASGYIVKRFRLTCPGTLKFCIAMAVCSLALSPMFLVLCDPVKLSGVQVPYPTDRDTRNSTLDALYLNSQCNSHCKCSEDDFRPVCGTVNNVQTTFFTSCYAGCPEHYDKFRKIYTNCSCADGNMVTSGWCESKCSALIGFLVLFAPMCLCTFSIGVPALSVILRCVDYNERSFALGIQWILIRCIGTIPAPAIFAWLFDISCLKRRKSTNDGCGINPSDGELSDGSCFIYDNKSLADLFLAFALIGQTVTLIFLVLASIFYRSNGREDLIVSEAPPQTPIVVMAPVEDGLTTTMPPPMDATRRDSRTRRQV